MSFLRAASYAGSAPRVVQTPPAIPAALRDSAIGQCSGPALERLFDELRGVSRRDFWLALVPGTSEQWGHHRAPPRTAEHRGERISTEFIARLRRAYRLLERDVVRFILISGGAIDASRPDFNEALRGREVFLDLFDRNWKGPGALADRILVDPLALHSTTNVRNADKLCADLGIDRVLIATTMPPAPYLWPVFLPIVYQTTQGWYFLHHRVSTFDWRCRRQIGYALGEFEWFENGLGPARITAIAHHRWPDARIRADAYGP